MKENNKVLFLDIDGPLISGRSHIANNHGSRVKIDPIGAAIVKKICDVTGCDVVLNSQRNRNYEEMAQILHEFGIKVIDKTLYPALGDRRTSIFEWLNKNPEYNIWCSVDDTEIDHENAVLVDFEDGISVKNYFHVCRVLKSPQPANFFEF